MILYGSVCSGIEAATVAWHPLGWQAAWFSEIEKFTSSVLAHHYPQVPNLGDMTLIAQKIRSGEITPPDILVGGTPCQAFSVAGLRGGLADARGQLSLSYVDLINAIDEKRTIPAIAVWENVPGVLSSKDNAFGCFLGALAGGSKPLLPTGRRWSNAGYIVGSKRSIAWRILDAQYFGVPQRRRRVFVISSARKDIDLAEILFEFESSKRNIKASGGSQENVTCFTPSSFGQYVEGVGTIKASGGDLGGGSENLITYGIPGNWIGRLPKNGGNATSPMINVSPCLTTTDIHAVTQDLKIRKTTPVENERLQGFPDNYTNIPNATDTPRYKALGNSMAVPVMRWLGERINDSI